MICCDEECKSLPPKALKPCDGVEMIKCPFVDMVARIATVTPDRRIWELMGILGWRTRVAVQADQSRTGWRRDHLSAGQSISNLSNVLMDCSLQDG